MLLILCILPGRYSMAQTELTGDARSELIEQINENLGVSTAMVVEFTQEKHIAMFDEPFLAEGVLLMDGENRIRFEILDPWASCLVMNMQSIAKYEKSGEQWCRLKGGSPVMLVRILKQVIQWSRGDFEDRNEVFDFHVFEEKDNHFIVLDPVNDRMKAIIHSVRIDLDREFSGFTALTIFENGGDFTRLVFSSKTTLNNIDPDWFSTDFSGPLDIQILLSEIETGVD